MAAQLTSPPAVEPVCLADAKAHLKIDLLDEDQLVVGLLEAARHAVEAMTGLALITQTWSVYLRYLAGQRRDRIADSAGANGIGCNRLCRG